MNRAIASLNSLFSSWDDQFFAAGGGSIKDDGGKLIKINTGISKGIKVGDCTLDTNFIVDFKNLTRQDIAGPFTSRAHECHILGVSH